MPDLRTAKVAVLAGALLGAITIAPTDSARASDEHPFSGSAVVAGTDGYGLRVRSGPGRVHRAIAVLPEGTPVSVLNGPISDGVDDWYEISYERAGIVGWVAGAYLAASDGGAPQASASGRSFVARITAYANGADGGAVGNITRSGTVTRWGVVAVDPRVIPLGSRLLIEGFDGVEFVAEDTGSGVIGRWVDIWFPDVSTARRFGVQYRVVTVLED